MTPLGTPRLRPRKPGSPESSSPKREQRPSPCGKPARISKSTSSGGPEFNTFALFGCPVCGRVAFLDDNQYMPECNCSPYRNQPEARMVMIKGTTTKVEKGIEP